MKSAVRAIWMGADSYKWDSECLYLFLTSPVKPSDNPEMTVKPIDLSSLVKALAQLQEALRFWQELPQGTALKPHLRSAVIQSFEFTYELSVRMLRRVLIERSEAADLVIDLSFNDLLRKAADAGLLLEPQLWQQWREMRNATSHTYDEAKAAEVAAGVAGFAAGAANLLVELEKSLAR